MITYSPPPLYITYFFHRPWRGLARTTRISRERFVATLCLGVSKIIKRVLCSGVRQYLNSGPSLTFGVLLYSLSLFRISLCNLRTAEFLFSAVLLIVPFSSDACILSDLHRRRRAWRCIAGHAPRRANTKSRAYLDGKFNTHTCARTHTRAHTHTHTRTHTASAATWFRQKTLGGATL